MTGPAELEALHHERSRLQEALASLSAMRVPATPHPEKQNRERNPLPAQGSQPPALAEGVAFVRPITLADVCWDDDPPAPATVPAEVAQSQPPDESQKAPRGEIAPADLPFFSDFDWQEQPVDAAEPQPAPEATPTSVERFDDVFNQFNWE